MKRRWFWVSAVALPLVLFVALLVAQAQLSWKPRLVATNPDGASWLNWAPDGKSVEVSPTDLRQVLKWGPRSLPANASAANSPKAQPRFELQQGELSATQKSSVMLLRKADNNLISLDNTPWELFGFDLDSTSYGWRFQDSGFSRDEKEVFILSAGTVYVWSTATGKLLRRVRIGGSKNINFSYGRFSPGCHLVAVRVTRTELSDAVYSGIYDVATGHKLFNISNGAGLAVDFSPDGRIYWVSGTAAHTDDLPDEEMQTLDFFDTRTGRHLWQSTADSRIEVKFLPSRPLVVITGDNGLELREVRTGRLNRRLNTLPTLDDIVSDIAVSPDDSQVWASYSGGQIWSWRLQ